MNLDNPQRKEIRALAADLLGRGGGVGVDVVDRADQPVDHVDVVAGLVHERAAVHVPAAAPRRGVVEDALDDVVGGDVL